MCSIPASGATLGNSNGKEGRDKVCLPHIKQSQVQEVERMNDTPEKLAVGLLMLLYTPDKLSSGNCTKPIRNDIMQLDSNRLWAIKCKCQQ